LGEEAENKTNNAVAEKSFRFSVRIVRLSRYLNTEMKEYTLSKQILRSGTSIGALISEAQYAQSKADFINKMHIAIKEANETLYWLRLLHETDYLNPIEFNSLRSDNEELIKLLTSIITSSKKLS
jgi:four helix bundle protein